MSFTYTRSEPSLWTVGERRPDGTWEPESDHGSPEEAARRAAWLNGAGSSEDCQCDRWTAAIARVATLEPRDIDTGRQISAHVDRGDTAAVVFNAGVAVGVQSAKDALREAES